MTRNIKITIIAITLVCIGIITKVLFFQKSYWYEAPGNDSRVTVGAYILAADVFAGSGQMDQATVSLWVHHQEEGNQTSIEISIACEKISLVIDGIVVKPDDPTSCRGRAGDIGPRASLVFSLPVTEPKKISLVLPPITIHTQTDGTTISPPISIDYYEKSKRIAGSFH